MCTRHPVLLRPALRGNGTRKKNAPRAAGTTTRHAAAPPPALVQLVEGRNTRLSIAGPVVGWSSSAHTQVAVWRGDRRVLAWPRALHDKRSERRNEASLSALTRSLPIPFTLFCFTQWAPPNPRRPPSRPWARPPPGQTSPLWKPCFRTRPWPGWRRATRPTGGLRCTLQLRRARRRLSPWHRQPPTRRPKQSPCCCLMARR
jgi:hypothetical protein